MSYEWLPPSAQKLSDDTLTQESAHGWHIRAVPKYSADTLAVIAAKEAFWQLGPAMLQKLARYFKVQLKRGASTFDIVHTMVMKVVQCDERAALAICEKRLLCC